MIFVSPADRGPIQIYRHTGINPANAAIQSESMNNEVAGVQRAERDVGQRYDVVICEVDQRIVTTMGGLE